jgi:hypothetical protein
MPHFAHLGDYSRWSRRGLNNGRPRFLFVYVLVSILLLLMIYDFYFIYMLLFLLYSILHLISATFHPRETETTRYSTEQYVLRTGNGWV